MNLETGEVYIYKTAHHERFERDWREKVVDVALATAAAPTYFPTHRSAVGVPLVDGGMWANNPVGMAVVEAIGVLGWERRELKVLSLGCSSEPLNAGMAIRYGLGWAYWGWKSVSVFMSAQSSASLGTARILTGDDTIYRICPQVARRRFGLDDVRDIAGLKGLGYSEARKALPQLKEVFFSDAAEEFVPIRGLRSS